MDIVDAMDPDLFFIFEEEAQELMPQLGGALRQWTARPDNRSARDEVLRALHTLKGSSRLAGALRLGELAHRMESEIEALGSERDFSAADLEPLLQRFDGLQANFDRVRAAGAPGPAESSEADSMAAQADADHDAGAMPSEAGAAPDGAAAGTGPFAAGQAGFHHAGATTGRSQPGGASALAAAGPSCQPGR